LRRLTLNNSSNRPAGWFPDNKSFLFYSNRSGNYGIYKQSVTGSEPEPLLVNNHADSIRPVATFDEKWLYYFSQEKSGNSQDTSVSLLRMPLRGGTPQLIDSQNDYYWALRCAAQAPTCVTEEHSESERLFYVFDADKGKKGSLLLRTKWIPGISYYDWDISQDGKQIAFIDEASDSNNITTFDMTSTTLKQLHIKSGAALHTLSWDNQRGFYASAYDVNGESFKVFHINMTGEIQVLRTEPTSKDGWALPSPDGKLLLLQKYSQHNNVWSIQY